MSVLYTAGQDQDLGSPERGGYSPYREMRAMSHYSKEHIMQPPSYQEESEILDDALKSENFRNFE